MVLSLPQLPDLQLVFAKHLPAMTIRLAHHIVKSWKQFAFGKQLKLPQIQLPQQGTDEIVEVLKKVARTIEIQPLAPWWSGLY